MGTIFETSINHDDSKFTLHKYKNLANMPHFHEDYEVVFVEDGTAKISINGNSFSLAESQAIFINSSEIHSITSSRNSLIYVLKLSNQHFGGFLDHKKFAHRVLNHEYFTGDFLCSIKNELEQMDKYSDLMILSMLSIVLTHMLRNETVINENNNNSNHHFDGRDTHFFLRISELMSANYNTITFKDAAKHMNYSEPYFSKHFKELFEMTFTEYLNILRIGNAIKMIKKGDRSITDISINCGFNTIRHFNRTFKDLTGYSPKNLPQDYVFIYRLRSFGIDPTLKTTELIL